jgi:hypothetical protein
MTHRSVQKSTEMPVVRSTSSKPQLASTGLLHCSQLVLTLMVDIPRLRHSPPTQCYGA